jgi:hypothetical protein
LGKKKGIRPAMFEGLSKRAIWRLQATQDFLKHGPDHGRGNRPPRPAVIIDGQAERFMKDALGMWDALAGFDWPNLFTAFDMYLSVHRPELYPPDFAAKQDYFSACLKKSREQMLELSASKYFALVLE